MDRDKAYTLVPDCHKPYYWGYTESLFFNAAEPVDTVFLPTEFFDLMTQSYVPFELNHFLAVFAHMDDEGVVWQIKLVDTPHKLAHTIEMACSESQEGIPEDFGGESALAYIDRLED